MRIGISLALSVLLIESLYAQEVCSSSTLSDSKIESGQTCTINTSKEFTSPITNEGTIILNTSASNMTFDTTSGVSITISNNGTNNRGSILVTGSGTIDASKSTSNGLSIEGQDISIDEYRTLTLKAEKVTLGASDSNKLTTITGNSTSVTSSTSWGVTLEDTTELDTKNVSLKNIRIIGSNLTTLKNTNTTLENTHIVSSNSSGLTLQTDSTSTFTLIGESNTISSGNNELKVEGTHSFSGSGTLDFIAGTGTITLGDSSGTKLSISNTNTETKDTPTLGFQANKVSFTNLESSGLTLQVTRGENAVISNISSTFTNGTLQALNTSGKDNVLVIENGNESNLTTAGTITINAGTTTFKGSGVQIYGQAITLQNSGASTLALSTIDDSGEIVLGKEDTTKTTTISALSTTTTNADGSVTIKGQNGGTSQTLQLRGTQTTIGGSVTLKNLQVTTQAKNTKASKGMLFSLSEGSTLTLNGATIISGIGENYQDLSFTTSEGASNLSISTEDSTIKASSLSFENQKIDLSSAGSGKALNLYSYGNVALSDKSGSGVGSFAFIDTTISDGSSATLNLYSANSAKVLASGLTLNNVTLTTYKINGTSNEKNAIDLTSGDFRTQGSVKIDTSEFLYGSTQGIGADITIEGGSGNGNLTLTSDTEGESFTFGGTLTIDNSGATSGKPDSSASQIDIKLGSKQNNGTKQDIDLFINGGLTAIGNATSGTTTTLKAKSFTFESGSVVSSINGTLSLSASADSGNIDLIKARTMLQGVSTAEATISKGSGTLSLGDVVAKGKTKITEATFNNSNITITSLGSGADTLTITSDSEVNGIVDIDLTDSNLVIATTNHTAQPILIDQPAQATTPQALKLKDNATITSRGTSTITASTITASDSGTYSINVESGTLTLKETNTTAGNGIGALTLGEEGKQGGNLALSNNGSSTYHTFKAPKVTSYNDSTITANTFDFNTSGATLSSTDGELKLISKATTPPNTSETLTIQKGTLTLDNASLSYYYTNNGSSTETLGKMTLHNTTTSVAITSIGDSSIQASELSLNGNTIISSEGVLTLQGLKSGSTLGAVTINNAGGLTATKTSNSGDLESVTLSKTLTLTANAPYTSSSSPLGGGKFGVLEAKSVKFSGSGGIDSPLIQIQVLDKPLEGEELFTLQEGGQVVVWTTDGITKNSSTPITLEDISLDSGGYKSLTLGAELVPDSTTTTQVNAIKVTLSVAQSSASELTEGIADNTAKTQMQTILSQGDNQAIIDSILGSSTNPLKVGFAENIIQGNVIVVGNALNYINDTFTSLSESLHLNDRVQTQIALSQSSAIEGRMARHNNPHQSQSELAKFIRTFHNTAYASSDDTLLSEEEAKPSGSGSLWVNYDGGLATGNSNNSTINGISAGYDHTLGSKALLGGFVNYAYGAFDSTYIHNTSHNIGFGLYSRAYFGSNELDLTVSQNIALVTSEVAVGNTTMPSLLNGVMDYNLYRTNLMARYGYTFKVGDEESPYYLKPLVGVNMSYTYQEGAETDAVASVVMNGLSLFKLDMSVGMEMRKYINEGTYFFLMPLIERDLYGSSCDVNVGFVDSSNLSYTLDYQSQTSVAIYAGGEGNLTDNLALNGSLGLKVGIEKSEVLTTWSVGLKYKF